MEYNINRICVDVFMDHWQQIIKAINQKNDVSGAETILKHLDILVSIIIKECDENCLSLDDILRYCDTHSIFQTIFTHFGRENMKGDIKEYGMYYQLKMYDNILNFLPCNYLMRYQIFSPLLKLLEQCSLRQSVKIEHLSVRLLYQITVLVTRDANLFQFIKNISERDFHESMFFVSLIILLIHRDKDIGRLSQEALLLILNYCSKDQDSEVVDYFCYRSDFAAILATGLSGMYSSFPRKLENLPEDWQQITVEFVRSVPELKHSLQLLDFCNLTLKMAHPRIQADILDFLYSGFLSPVIGPSLHQNSLEETISATAYLELFLRHLHQPSLTKLFLQFILLEKQDNYVVLDSLINRLNSLTMLGVVTLSLFRTILSFHCEDVMYHLIFKYLIPCDHLIKQKWGHVSLDSSTEDLSQCNTLLRSGGKFFKQSNNDNDSFNEDLSNSAEQFLKLSFGTYSEDGNEIFGSMDLGNEINHSNSDLRRGSYGAISVNNLQNFSSISPFYSYLESSALYVNRRILASSSWTMNYDGVNPPSDIFNLVDIYNDQGNQDGFPVNVKKSDETIHGTRDAAEVDESSPLFFHGNPDTDAGRILPHPVSPPQNPENPEENPSTISRLCDPCQSSKDIYKLNYFSFESPMLETEIMDEMSSATQGKKGFNQNHGKDDKLENINMENVILTTHQDCSFLDFLVSLDLFELEDQIDWNIDWININQLLIEHNADPTENYYVSLTTASSEESLERLDISQCRSTPTNEIIFKERLQSFEYSIISPKHANFSITLGPFLTALFQRLQALPTNTVFMNLLITGIITDLASYPNALLKSLILDIDIILQPHISKVYEIVSTLKESIIRKSSTIPNWENLLVKAYEYMYSRIESSFNRSRATSFSEEDFGVRLFNNSPTSVNSSAFDFGKYSQKDRLSVSSSPRSKEKKSRIMPFGILTRKKKKDEVPIYKFPVQTFSYSKKNQMSDLDIQHIRNLAYSWVVFDEFCKELASLCQEHTLHCFF